jgi:signal transduction histidine kinase
MHFFRKTLSGPDRLLSRSRWEFGLRQATVVVLATIAAMGARALVAPWIGETLPFVFAFPTVAGVAFFVGITSGALVAICCAAWLLIPGMPPEMLAGVNWSAAATFLPAAFFVAFFAGQVRRESEPVSVLEDNNTVRWLRLSMVLAAVLPTLVFATAAWLSYREAFSDARLRIDRNARIAQEHASKVVETSEAIIRHVLDLVSPYEPQEIPTYEAGLHRKLIELSARVPQVQSIWVFGPDGKTLLSNRYFPNRPIDASDRENFRFHVTGDYGFYLSEPHIGRATGEAFFDVSRRWDRDGQFGGVVSVSMFPSYFTDFYRKMAEDEPGLAVTMLRNDGVVIARWPNPPDPSFKLPPDSLLLRPILKGGAEGRVEGISSVDGIERLNAFRKLDHYPVYVLAGIERHEIVNAWQRRTAVLATLTFPTALALVYVAWVALRRTRRELEAIRRLKDETEQRARAESALRQAQKLEALGHLTGGVAHDFNNLLMVVNNNLHLLRHGDRSLEHNPQVDAIGRAVVSGERLTRQLLAFARRQPLHPELVRLQDRLPVLLTLVAPTLGSRIDAHAEVAPDTQAIVVDVAELELAIINLAINAKDAMPSGGQFIMAARNARPDETPGLSGQFVVIVVSDTGSGIPVEIQERVFEPFFTTKPPGRGTGLGLSQVYGLCTQAGGTARISGGSGVGTQVLLYLPVATSAVEPPPEADDPNDSPIDCVILLVEDNIDVRMTTKPLLETFGCRVDVVINGDEARAAIDANPGAYDLVVTDIVMPGSMDGLDLSRYLREHHPNIAVVILTGYSEHLQRAADLRFTVLAKPCPPRRLMAVLRESLAARAAKLRAA